MGSRIPTPPAFSQRSGPALTHELAAKNLLQEASYAMACQPSPATIAYIPDNPFQELAVVSATTDRNLN